MKKIILILVVIAFAVNINATKNTGNKMTGPVIPTEKTNTVSRLNPFIPVEPVDKYPCICPGEHCLAHGGFIPQSS